MEVSIYYDNIINIPVDKTYKWEMSNYTFFSTKNNSQNVRKYYISSLLGQSCQRIFSLTNIYYVPPGRCIMVGSCTKWLLSNQTAVDIDNSEF
jgi:hypothetical protein